MKNKTLQGDWHYRKTIDFRNFKVPDKTIYKKEIQNPIIIKEFTSVIPCSPKIPLIKNNVIFLGDSFGNPTTSSACGINVILKTSEILTNAIKKKNISLFQKNWKKKYLETYIRFLVTKLDSYHNSKILQKMKQCPTRIELLPILSKYPEIFKPIMDCSLNFEMPKEFKNQFPKRAKLFQAYYYLYLKLKYKSIT